MKPRAVLFDWDNTLVDTWPVIHAALHHTFTEMGQEPWTLETVQKRVSKSMRDSFPEIFGEGWERAGSLYQGHYRENHLATLAFLPEAEATREALALRNIPLGIVSNKRGPVLRLEVEHLGWKPHAKSVVGADDAARDKPHADPLLMALAQMEIEPGEDVWFVGDSEVDLACAEAAGCTPVLYGPLAVNDAAYTQSHYRGHRYHRHALTHADLAALLNG